MAVSGLLHAIDFGTWNSEILVCRPDGTRVEVADPAVPADSRSIRTSICVDRGRVLVGKTAENYKKARPGAYRSTFKRDFGDPTPTAPGGQRMTADEMTVHVLRFLREQAQAAVSGEPEHVVVTVPASWEAGRLDLMRSCVKLAGYEYAAVDLVPEPVAALAHVFSEGYVPAEEITALVYDLGGGTFDCAVARGSAGWYEALGGPGGVADIGGASFNALLLGKIRKDFGPAAAALLDGQTDDVDTLRGRLNLYDICEEFKCALSVRRHHEDLLTPLKPQVDFGLSRAAFEALIRGLVNETVDECERLLGDLGIGWSDVDRVVPVGGSSVIPLVKGTLAKRSGCTVMNVGQPEMAVVRGAALMARDGLLGQAPRRIFVNGRPRVMRAAEVGFTEIVESAFERRPPGRNVTYTVTFSRAAGARQQGSLAEGGSVKVRNGTVFNVTATDKS